jgi:hypothetical protein
MTNESKALRRALMTRLCIRSHHSASLSTICGASLANRVTEGTIKDQVVNEFWALRAECARSIVVKPMSLQSLECPTTVLRTSHKKNLFSIGALVFHTSFAPNSEVCPRLSTAYADNVE